MMRHMLPVGQVHDIRAVVTGEGGKTMYEPFCSCGWHSGGLATTRALALDIAAAHAKAASEASEAAGEAAGEASEVAASVPAQIRAAHHSVSTYQQFDGWVAECSCGWQWPGHLTRRDAQALGKGHVYGRVWGKSPAAQPQASPSPATLTDERKSGDSVWERHKIGDCADPCIYCMDERAERQTRPAAEIMAELETMQARVVSLEEDDVLVELPRAVGVRDALAWVLRVHGYTKPS